MVKQRFKKTFAFELKKISDLNQLNVLCYCWALAFLKGSFLLFAVDSWTRHNPVIDKQESE